MATVGVVDGVARLDCLCGVICRLAMVCGPVGGFMKAVIFREHGGTDKLEYTDVPEPKISANEVLVRVRACALNHLDIWVRQGLGTPLEIPHISGNDIAGEVAAVGANVKSLQAGQRIIISPCVTDGTIDE